jgi:hypothetical protein
MSDEVIEMLDDSRRHSRDVTYSSGKWHQLTPLIPTFELADFRAADSDPANPHLKAVVRLPLKSFERRMPVGIVSNSYSLTQHAQVAEQCFVGLRSLNLDPYELKCDLGLSDLGEWMNLRIYFPEAYNHVRNDSDSLGLRLECFNSVDGSSRLVLVLGWIRFICSNGMVIGETRAELRDTHDRHLDLEPIPEIVRDAMEKVELERKRLTGWEEAQIDFEQLENWINKDVSDSLGKKAACRVFNICRTGRDAKITDPFASGEATQKPVELTDKVPGSGAVAQNFFDVSQALSWVASGRLNAEERLAWQTKIPQLMVKLSRAHLLSAPWAAS